MSSDGRKSAAEIFEKAAEMDASQRGPYLDQACADDAALRAEVESLLAADAAAGDFLEAPLVDLASNTQPTSGESPRRPPDISGQTLGAYRLQRVLGVGGMGTVYLAERQDGAFEKQVAVKLISRGLERPELLERFRTERQVLATLDHPGIARLLDGGTTPEGFPYLVMEYVDGVPIDVYCKERNLDLRQRLQLFLQVCESVSYAHRHLVTHRDLKPSNILVDGDGRVTLVDFGIARIEEGEDVDPAEKTGTGSRLATPLYASPEYIRGQSVTTTSDVYSLGVTLYKLITGTLPYRIDSGTAVEMLSLFETSQPVRPSQAVGIDPAWAQQLRGDLDRVLLMAMHQEPERRYASVDLFAEDIDHFLRDQPVRAQVDSLGYRFRKFARRNRGWLGVGAGFAVLLLLATVVSFTLYRRAEVARTEAQEAQLHAETSAATANRVTDFLTDLFDQADPAENRGADLTARDLIDLGARRVRSELDEEPAVQSQVMKTIGEVYNSLGMPDSAEALLVDAVTLARQAHGDISQEVASALRAYGDHLVDLSRFPEARTQFDEALSILNELYGPDDLRVAPYLNRLVHSTPNMPHEEEIALLERSLSIVEANRPPDDPLVAFYLVNLSAAWRSQGEYDKAMPLLERAVAIREAQLEPDDPMVAQSMGSMGQLLIRMDRHEDAVPYLERAYTILSSIYGEESAQVTPSLHNLASVHLKLERYEEARDAYDRCRAMNARTYGDDNFRVGFDNMGMGNVCVELNDLETAEDCYNRALAIFAKRYGPTHYNNGRVFNGLGRVATARGDYETARGHHVKALNLFEEGLRPDHPYVEKTLEHLEVALQGLGDAEAAQAARSRAEALRAQR